MDNIFKKKYLKYKKKYLFLKHGGMEEDDIPFQELNPISDDFDNKSDIQEDDIEEENVLVLIFKKVEDNEEIEIIVNSNEKIGNAIYNNRDKLGINKEQILYHIYKLGDDELNLLETFDSYDIRDSSTILIGYYNDKNFNINLSPENLWTTKSKNKHLNYF